MRAGVPFKFHIPQRQGMGLSVAAFDLEVQRSWVLVMAGYLESQDGAMLLREASVVLLFGAVASGTGIHQQLFVFEVSYSETSDWRITAIQACGSARSNRWRKVVPYT